MYRLVQEALTNVTKHAQASNVRVTVSSTDGDLSVQVQDDGVGFDVDSTTVGFGLAGVRERVYLAGGTLELESGKDGTLLRAFLPRRPGSGATQTASRPRRSA